MPLHEVFAAALEAGRRAGRPALSQGSVSEARALVDDGAKALGPGPDVWAVQEHVIPTRSGSINARLYKPTAQAPGLIVYFHGGGWVAGSASGFDALARTLAVRSGCAVLNVDYRLAPEHPFPGGLEDAEDALRWAHGQRDVLAGEAAKLVVAGDSAGGNLATVAALALRTEFEIALQVLFYPVTDADMTTPSYGEHGQGLLLTRADMAWFFSLYAPEKLWTHPRISPLRADLRGAPAAWIAMAEYDVLCSEGQAYAQRLAQADVSVQVRTYAGTTHGFARWFNLVDTNAALDDAAQAIRAACA